MRFLYKPIAIIAGLISARIGKSVFTGIWSAIDDEPPPTPKRPDAGVGKVVGAQALQAAVMAATAAAVDRAFAASFFHLFGIWPGKPAKPEESEKS
ncbi:MAG: DUF4235 domain-containing protein [Solirubrobacteraceae bacterium]